MLFMTIPGMEGKQLPPTVVMLILLAVLVIVVEGLRVTVLIVTSVDDTALTAAANVLLTAFITAVAAERVARHLGSDK